MNIILFGFKGSGKTYFGRLLAKELKRRFVDTDDRLVDLYAAKKHKKLSPREIYQLLGESGFRVLEKEALQTLCNDQDSVIALGGGAVLDGENVELFLNLGKLVYLEASFETLSKRILSRETPSFIDAEDRENSLRAIYHERRPLYESILAARINVDLLDEPGVLASLRSLAILEE